MTIELQHDRIYHHPTDLGGVILREHRDDHGQPVSVDVLHADPRVLISGELLRQLHDGQPNDRVPFAEVDHPDVGGTLRIHASDRNLVYRIIARCDGCIDVFIGEWPD